MHVFEHGRLAFVGVVKVPQGFEFIVRAQQLAGFNAQRFGDQQGLFGDLFVEAQQLIQLARRQEVPVFDGAANGFDIGVVFDQFLFDFGVHAPVHPTNALHQSHGVPVQVVVDEARGVLQVQAFTEHIGGNQHTRFRLSLGLQVAAGHAVVVGGKLANHVAAAALGA